MVLSSFSFRCSTQIHSINSFFVRLTRYNQEQKIRFGVSTSFVETLKMHLLSVKLKYDELQEAFISRDCH